MITSHVRLASFRFFTITGLLLLALSLQAKAITLNFQGLNGTVINFDTNSTFGFTSTNGYQFSISSVSGGAMDSVGLNGFVSPGGPFIIGTIQTFGSTETAPVTGSGTLHITDTNATDLTGTIQWDTITTVSGGAVTEITGELNLTAIAYSGANSDLLALKAAGTATDDITLHFSPAKTLTQLASGGGQTAYSGTIFAVPEPGTWMLVVTGTCLGAFLRGRSGIHR
jgi:hypothetical protein